jgi:hypothetical protein
MEVHLTPVPSELGSTRMSQSCSDDQMALKSLGEGTDA